MLHGRCEVLEDPGGLDPGVAPDRDDGRGPHEDDLRLRAQLVHHRHGRHADTVIQDDDVRRLIVDHARQIGRPSGLADHVEAFALEDEAK